MAGGGGLEASGVSCFRGERLVLDGVSFAVARGGALLLLGPNGAGKSTLLRVLAGLKRVDAGRVLFDGDEDYAGRVAFLGHQDAVKPGLTAVENLAFAARMVGGVGRPARSDVVGGAEAKVGAGAVGVERCGFVAAG